MALDSSATFSERNQSEKAFQGAVRELAELWDWTIFSTWDARNSPCGDPDLRLIRPPLIVYAELKTMDGIVTLEQRNTLELLSRCPGVETYLWRPNDWDEIAGVLGPRPVGAGTTFWAPVSPDWIMDESRLNSRRQLFTPGGKRRGPHDPR